MFRKSSNVAKCAAAGPTGDAAGAAHARYLARWALTPPVLPFSLDGVHRLIPSLYSEAGTLLADIADSEEMLEDMILMDGATNNRIQGEQQGLIGISTYELVYGIPNAHIVNAAFTHTQEAGSRFNDHTRGAWYAAEELETSLAEVTYHKARRLARSSCRNFPESGQTKKFRPSMIGWLISGRISMRWSRSNAFGNTCKLSRFRHVMRPRSSWRASCYRHNPTGLFTPAFAARDFAALFAFVRRSSTIRARADGWRSPSGRLRPATNIGYSCPKRQKGFGLTIGSIA
jgi:hypothetical protein